MSLTEYVKQVSLEDFGWEFRHQAKWNHRLRSTGGRFFPKDGHLDFNPKVYRELGPDVFRKIVRHELCHYHLYFQKKGYQHRDKDFKELLQKVDGLRYVPTLPSNQVAKGLTYHCIRCGQVYKRKRRINLTHYRCGVCHGRLQLLNQPKD